MSGNARQLVKGGGSARMMGVRGWVVGGFPTSLMQAGNGAGSSSMQQRAPCVKQGVSPRPHIARYVSPQAINSAAVQHNTPPAGFAKIKYVFNALSLGYDALFLDADIIVIRVSPQCLVVSACVVYSSIQWAALPLHLRRLPGCIGTLARDGLSARLLPLTTGAVWHGGTCGLERYTPPAGLLSSAAGRALQFAGPHTVHVPHRR